jgi:hypothetical protein
VAGRTKKGNCFWATDGGEEEREAENRREEDKNEMLEMLGVSQLHLWPSTADALVQKYEFGVKSRNRWITQLCSVDKFGLSS